MKFRITCLLFCLAAAVPGAGLPRVVQDHGRFELLVDDQPYLMLGVQVHNSSGWPGVMESNWPLLKTLGCNTVSVPVYWEAVEPRPGEFTFAGVDAIVQGARQNGLRLVLLWFGTWKNGSMDYAPEWVKQDPQKYPRMVNAAGRPIRVLSLHSAANLDADRRAFGAFMTHLKQVDGDRHTVIMVQVENEAGSLGTDRDYSAVGNEAFHAPVPELVLTALGKKPGQWAEVFGPDAPEVFAAYHVARYIEGVAAAGKEAYALPLYINVWPREQAGFIRPGESHPSGGAVSNLLGLWKAVARHIDILAPDIYDKNFVPYRLLCERYLRPDNALLIPETGTDIEHARHLFYALGEFGGLGITAFGVDTYAGGAREKRFQQLSTSYRMLAPAAPALLAIRSKGNLRAAVEEEGLTDALVSFEDFDAVARFGPVRNSYSGEHGTGNPGITGRVLIGQSGPDEFLIVGADANIVFRPRLGEARATAQILRAEEGVYESGVWKVTRLLNGDETYFGIPLSSDGTTIKVKLTKY